jgi:hypothetical protein
MFNKGGKMKQKNKGQRHPLLLYRRMMDRFILATLPLGVVMVIVQWPGLGFLSSGQQNNDTLLMFATFIILGMAFLGNHF